jgi:Ca-activated chloride channel family protein
MKRIRLLGGIAGAGVMLMLVVSAFPAQQPPVPSKEPVPPGGIDPGFVPGQSGTISPLNKAPLQQLKNALLQQQVPPQTASGPNQAGAQGAVAAGAPEAFKSKEGKTGWRVTIPGNRPLATPAVADGKIFLGGGFGSHEFYSLDAKTGKQQWVYRTGDDGPTAAVISGDLIAFNTESCELEIITRAGKPLWKKWLGDPLMSMPAIHQGKVFMAYPDSKGGGGHKLACFDLKTGKEEWKKPIAGEIITAPVIDNDCVYLTTVEGTVYNFTCKDGELLWSEKKNATSSPAVHKGRLYYSQREVAMVAGPGGKQVKQQQESLAAQPAAKPSGSGSPGGVGGFSVLKETTRPADYLDAGKRATYSGLEKQNKAADAGVGFSAAPAAANLGLAEMNIGQLTVNGVWAYQGSRPFIYKDNLVSSMGDEIKCVDPKTEKVIWKHSVRDAKDKGPLVDAALTPPAVVNGKLFIGTTAGQIICLNAESGAELWRATVGDPILFQPAVAHGRVFVGTGNGKIYCIETGDESDHGWMMWGGNPGHNGRSEQ